MRPIDLSEILSKYKKGWLALSPDNRKLIAKGKTLKEVLKRGKEKGIENPSVLKAVPIKHLFAG